MTWKDAYLLARIASLIFTALLTYRGAYPQATLMLGWAIYMLLREEQEERRGQR